MIRSVVFAIACVSVRAQEYALQGQNVWASLLINWPQSNRVFNGQQYCEYGSTGGNCNSGGTFMSVSDVSVDVMSWLQVSQLFIQLLSLKNGSPFLSRRRTCITSDAGALQGSRLLRMRCLIGTGTMFRTTQSRAATRSCIRTSPVSFFFRA